MSAALSRRLPWEHPKNRLTLAVEERAARGVETIDLTETNPTRGGLAGPAGGGGRGARGGERAGLPRRGAVAAYEPHPRGIPAAREALAEHLSTPGDPV